MIRWISLFIGIADFTWRAGDLTFTCYHGIQQIPVRPRLGS
ncbi:MAG: hypothetical protein QOG75_1860 [Mycobacterium sp.]|jgi:hypothetical protein|nr:hypothetical protein [Mycobacterium sp.]